MWNIDLDLLYWSAQENGLAFAAEKKAINPSFDWNLGFRMNMGYRFRPNSWEVDLAFTNFNTHAWGDAQGKLTPLWSNPFFLTESGFIRKADLRWRLHFGQFDLILKRDLEHFIPFFGLRVSSIRQKNRVHYYGGTLFPHSEDLITSKNKFLGTGVILGCNSRWELAKAWKWIAGGAFSLLYGEYYIHQAEYADIGAEKRFGLHETFFSISPVLDLMVGIMWDKDWWNIHLGFEEHYFFGQNQWNRIVSKTPGIFASNLGDLSIQGGSFGASVNF